MTGEVAGRDDELAVITELLRDAGPGFRALVLEGEAGIGKTTLWRSAVALAERHGGTVLRTRPARAERDLAFSALGDLLEPVPDARIDALPAPQRDGLRAALLRGPVPAGSADPRAVGRAVVAVIGGLAAHGRVVLAVDDTQWLDPASARTLAFAVRRLEDHPVTLVAARRPDEDETDLLAGVPAGAVRRITVGPMPPEALAEMVGRRLGARPSRAAMARISQAARGNPFFTLEVVHALAGAEPGDDPLPVPGDLRRLVRSRMRTLPRGARRALLRAAALAHPTTALVDAEDLAPAEEAQIVRVGDDGSIEFAHPLFAEAVYAAAPRARRRELHARLALAVDDPEEHARHLALATDGPDAAVAAALDAAAVRAARRGAPDIAARHAEHAARRTPPDDPEAAFGRLLEAGEHHVRGGNLGAARGVAGEVLQGVPWGPVRARALLLDSKALVFVSPDAPRAALEEALMHVGTDGVLAARIELGLGLAAMGRSDRPRGLAHLERAAALSGPDADGAFLAEVLAFREGARLFLGRGADEEALLLALELEDPDRDPSQLLRPSMLVAAHYMFTGRLAQARTLLLDQLDSASARGEEGPFAWSAVYLATASVLAGELSRALDESEAAHRAAVVTGHHVQEAWARAVQALAAVLAGDEEAGRDHARFACETSVAAGWPDGDRQGRWALALLALNHDDPAEAARLLDPVAAATETAGVYEWPIAFAAPDAIEAFARSGQRDRAAALAAELTAWGVRFGRPWCTAMGARGRAIVAAEDGDLAAALDATDEALAAHDLMEMPLERARTLLLRGRIERRLKRRAAARTTLGEALAQFDRLGAAPHARHARLELQRIGGRTAAGGLSDTELRVARLAAEGHTNAQIAAILFISRRTVESNLARAYTKIGVKSRTQLANAMRDGALRHVEIADSGEAGPH